MKILKSLLFLVSGAAVAYAVLFDEPRGYHYISSVLGALSSIPPAFNFILSVDPKTLPEKRNQDTLLKLQTIMYTMRTKGVCLKGEYVLDFVRDISASFPEGWKAKERQDEAEYHQNLVQTIEKDLLPADKRATFHNLLNVKQELISASNSTTVDTPVIRIKGTSFNVKSIQDGLDSYFGVSTATTSDSSPLHRIAVDPSVLSVHVDIAPAKTADELNKISYLIWPLDIKNYRSANLAGSTSPRYMASYDGMYCKDRPENGHYLGYSVKGELRIKPADYDVPDKNVTEPTSACQDYALLLHFVNANQGSDLLKENQPVPKNVMALIDGELAKHATVEKKSSWFEFKNDVSGLASGILYLFSTMVAVIILN